jgi:hypothetical protein
VALACAGLMNSDLSLVSDDLTCPYGSNLHERWWRIAALGCAGLADSDLSLVSEVLTCPYVWILWSSWLHLNSPLAGKEENWGSE